MPALIETVELIGKTMDEIIDFVVCDDVLGADFENFLIKNNIQIEKEKEFNDILISYLLDGKMQDGIRVLDYFKTKNSNISEKIIESLKKSYVSVFEIKKIGKNFYITEDIISKKENTLIPLVKTVNLRGIGLYDFINARVIEIEDNLYILEIYDSFGQYRKYFAYIEALKNIIKNPKIAVLHNVEKFLHIKRSISNFNATFNKIFQKNEIIVSNKNLDSLLDDFYNFHIGKTEKIQYDSISPDFDYKFFEIGEFKNDFLINAMTGFSKSEAEYDVGLYFDKDLGFFIIPFLGTVNKILDSGFCKTENDKDCIQYFLTNINVTPNMLLEKSKNPKFIEIVNNAAGKNFETVNDIVDFYKYDFKDGFRLSPLNVLYESDIFSKVLEQEK